MARSLPKPFSKPIVACGIILVVLLPKSDSFRTVVITSGITVFVNGIFTGLIVVRVMGRQKRICELLREGCGSPYSRIVVICVESVD